MAKKRKRRRRDGGADANSDPGRGKKPKGLAAVGVLKSQGTRAFRKRRAGS